jgi:AraC family transcriptional regulator
MQENISRDDRSASFTNSAPPWARLADDAERADLERLRAVVAELCKAVASTREGEREAARQYIERADLFLRSELSATGEDEFAISDDQPPKPVRGGLAPWQVRRVKTHIEANLDGTIGVKALAQLVKLSSFHFCRAFRESFGDSPHGYLMRRRVERAQGLMLSTNASLGQIAADCGLADQAHFNRLFRRLVGESPGMWRRARATASG